MYWLETTNTTYRKFCNHHYQFLHEAMTEYNKLIKSMMANLPEEEWFNLKLMRLGEDGDCLPFRDQVVRAWVY